MSLPTYSNYKDGDAFWMGRLPEHWEILKGAHIGRLFGSEAVSENAVSENGGLPFIKVGSLSSDTLEIASWDWYVDEITMSRVTPRSNFVVFPKRGAAIFSNKVNVVDRPALIDPNLMGWEIGSRAVTKFIAYTVKARKLSELADISTVPQINNKHIEPEKFPVPPLSEQVAIVAFLDRETGKIDALIAEQGKLLILLAEKRQATISHAVTRGVNPDVPTKASGVAWLGDVPAHWAVRKAGYDCNVLSGFAFPSSGFSLDDSDVKLLRGANVGVGKLKWDDVVYWRREASDELDSFELRAGDIVLGMDRPWISDGLRVARVSECDIPCLLLQRVAAIRPSTKLDADYLYFLLCAGYFFHHCSPEMTGVSVPHISPEQIRSFAIPVPPVDEQRAIAEFIVIECGKLDTLGIEAKRAIDLLKERRSVLISAAVTGKIDVRNVVSRELAA